LSFQISKCLACATTPQIFSAKHETVEHVILTKNGYGDMVVVSYEEYQRIQHVLSVMAQLREAEWEARSTNDASCTAKSWTASANVSEESLKDNA